MYFNRRILNENNLDDPYSLVRSGDWTLDNMTSMALTAAKDLNGDGSLTPEDDLLGYIAQLTVNRSLQEGFGLSLFTDDKNGNISFTGVTEKYADAYAKMWSFFVGNPATYIYNEHEPINAMFMSGRALFNTNFLSATDNFRDMADDFGIVPMPKYDENQSEYHSRVCYYFPSVVPATCQDTDFVGYMLETLNYESYKTVIPAYYETALKTKYSRDAESSEMLDLIFASRRIDIGDSTLCDIVRDNFIYTMMKNDKRDIISTVARNEKTINKRLEQ